MEDRLKERLTGAVLLVAAVVVLVPAIFRGERPDLPAATSAAGPSLQTYTIDLKGAAPPPSSSESTSLEGAAPESMPAGEASPSNGETGRPVVQVADAAPAEARALTPLPAPTLPTPTRIEARADPKVAKPMARAAEKPKAAASIATVQRGGFIVQVGSFNKRENAALMVKQAARKGVKLTVAGPDDRGNFRVRTAMVRTRPEAVALQEHLQSQGLKGVIGAAN